MKPLEATGLQQHIQEPTHYMGHTLDVFISRDNSTLLSNISVADIGLCNKEGNLTRNHYAIVFSINRQINGAVPQTVTYRKFRSINIEDFKSDIRKTAVLNRTEGDIHKLADKYIPGLSSLVDHHAPIVLRTIMIRPNTSWYTEELRDDKRLRRRLERKRRSNKQDYDKQASYREQCATVALRLYDAKTLMVGDWCHKSLFYA